MRLPKLVLLATPVVYKGITWVRKKEVLWDLSLKTTDCSEQQMLSLRDTLFCYGYVKAFCSVRH